MSLLPVVLNDFFEDFINPAPLLYDQHFGLGLNPSIECATPRYGRVPLHSGYLRPWRNTTSSDSGISSLEDTKTNFKVSLDVQQFKPEEISVKLQDDYLVVEGKHEERQDKHGYITRQFQRRYRLPENVDETKIKSTLSSDGVLTLNAPKTIVKGYGERTIPIEATNRPAIRQQSKEPKQGEQKMES